MVTLAMDMEEDFAMLFGDDDFSDDGLDDDEDDDKLVKKVIMVSDAEVADSVAIREIGPRVYIVEGQMQVASSHCRDPLSIVIYIFENHSIETTNVYHVGFRDVAG
nr:hypothetical protein [Tanacetum cinerariifolium]